MAMRQFKLREPTSCAGDFSCLPMRSHFVTLPLARLNKLRAWSFPSPWCLCQSASGAAERHHYGNVDILDHSIQPTRSSNSDAWRNKSSGTVSSNATDRPIFRRGRTASGCMDPCGHRRSRLETTVPESCSPLLSSVHQRSP